MTAVPAPLGRHLADWLGGVPQRERLDVVGCDRRVEPDWDGRLRPFVGVVSPAGSVLSVPPDMVRAVRGVTEWRTALPGLFGAGALVELVLRFTSRPAPLPDAGAWTSADDPALPDWLRPFGPSVLAVMEDGGYVAGAGIKRHGPAGHEIAVGTEPAWRGRGHARRLVAQAARAILAAGALPIYVHDPRNLASARVAAAAGFPDAGFRLLLLADVDI